MFNKILVALDGSEISLRAYEHALDLAKKNNAELHALYVVEKGIAASAPVDTNRVLISHKLEDEGRELLKLQYEKAKDAGVELISHLEEGHAGDIIIDIAKNLECDLIVLGSLGKTKLDRLLLGSVSSYVVKSAKTNILVIRN